MHNRAFALALVLLSFAAGASAQGVDRRVDRAGEAAVDAELGGERAPPPRERERERDRTRRQPVPADPPARAQSGGRRKKPISLGLLLGYGFELDELGVNPWGIGFGARGGYNVGAIFLGGRFVFYLGEDPASAGGTGSASNIWEIGLEGGYDFKTGVMTLRPGFGFGLASLVVDTPGVDSTTDAYIAPGLSLLFDVSRDLFIGVEGRVQFILSDPDGFEAIVVLGNFGMRF